MPTKDYLAMFNLQTLAEPGGPLEGFSEVMDKVSESLAQVVKKVNTEPSDAQIEAGNYRKGHYYQHGLHFIIENPIGSTRSGIGPDGEEWSSTMRRAHYGYIAGTEGADGDEVDVFLNPEHIDVELVFVVNQNNPVTGAFDEHKACLGFLTEEDAKAGYLANYETGWKGFGSIKPMTVPDFKRWLKSSAHKKSAVDKFADAYRFFGTVQGVHLRKKLHHLLDKYNVPGMAYNDAINGDVHAYINAPADTRQKILSELTEQLKSSPHFKSIQTEEVPEKERMRKVSLSQRILQRMFERQGFKSHEHSQDPGSDMRHWVEKRYRLQEDPKTHNVIGQVPERAYRQIMGLEPIYQEQYQHPEHFGKPYWKDRLPAAALQPEPPPLMPELSHPGESLIPTKAAAVEALWSVEELDKLEELMGEEQVDVA